MIGDFSFLTSRRFWALVLIAIFGVLKTEGILGVDVCNALILILTGFTAIRTIDKVAESIKG